MKRMNLESALSAILSICGPIMATSALAQSQGGHGMGSGGMMDGYATGWMGTDGYGGLLLPILLVVVIAGLVAWIVARNKK